MRVYLAGPLFTPYERAFVDECAAALRAAGHEVFVPHEQKLALGETPAAEIFALDHAGLAVAEAVVAVLDGAAVDDGTACEVGLFYGLMQADPSKRAIVGLLTDVRPTRGRAEPALNLFVLGCVERAGCVCGSIEEAVEALRAL